VEVEAVEMRVPRSVRQDPWGVRLIADAPDAGARAGAQSNTPLDQGAADASERR
jgi:hypothetical protein